MPYQEHIPSLETPAAFIDRLLPEIEVELERRRPDSPEAIADERSPIDWWHYAAMAAALKELTDGTFALGDDAVKNIQHDIEAKLTAETGAERIWNYALYASRLRQLDVPLPVDPAAYEQSAIEHIATLRAAESEHAPWYLAYYLAKLADSYEKAPAQATEGDWQSFGREAAHIAADKGLPDGDFLLAELLASLRRLDAKKADQLTKEYGIDLPALRDRLKAKALETRAADNSWMMHQYVRVYKEMLEYV